MESLFQTHTVLQQYPIVEKTSGDNIKEKSGKTSVVSMSRRVQTSLVSGRTPQPSTEPIAAYFYVPYDFLIEGQDSGLGTVHTILTSNFFSTWHLPLEKRKTLAVINGLKKMRR